MARKYEMTMADYKSLNKKALIFNLIIMAVAVASILTLLLTNFWKVKLKFEMNESMLSDVFGIVSEDSEEGSDILGNLDSSAFEDLSIEASLSIEPDVLLTVISGGKDAVVTKLISSVVSDLSRQAADILSNVLKPLTKTLISTALDEIENQIEAELGDDFLDELNLEGIDNIIDMIIEGTTEENLKAEIKNFIEKIAIDAGLEGEDLETFKNEVSGLIEESVDSMAKTIGDEDGNISFTQIIVNLAGEALGFDTKNMSAEDIANELAAYLVEQIPPEAIDIIYYIMIGLAVLLLMPVVAWALLFLFGFIRIFTKKKILYMGLARGFGILPYILLVIIPWLGFLLVNLFMETLVGLSLRFSSVGLLVSFIGACVLALLKWIRYGRIKKRIKHAVITDKFDEFSSENPGDSPNMNFSEFPERSSNDFSYDQNPNDFNSGNSDENFW